MGDFWEQMKTYDKWLKSEENQMKCMRYKCYVDKFNELYQANVDNFTLLQNKCREQMTKVEYGNGAVGLHRGYYSPSKSDIVIGGIKRGKLLKRVREGNYQYEYIFNEEGELIAVKEYTVHLTEGPSLYSIEFLEYKDSEAMSFYFHVKGEEPPLLKAIASTVYEENRVIEFQIAYWFMGKSYCDKIQVEKSNYQQEMLNKFSLVIYHVMNQGLQELNYEFYHEKDSEEIHYYAVDIEGNKKDDRIYVVSPIGRSHFPEIKF